MLLDGCGVGWNCMCMLLDIGGVSGLWWVSEGSKLLMV